jgi:hypothetical protein
MVSLYFARWLEPTAFHVRVGSCLAPVQPDGLEIDCSVQKPKTINVGESDGEQKSHAAAFIRGGK